jgi:hypothetical protein
MNRWSRIKAFLKELAWTAMNFALGTWIGVTVINGQLEMVRSRPVPRTTQRAQRDMSYRPRGSEIRPKGE